MKPTRLSALLLLLAALALAGCGNKHDLFMPPPPDDDEMIDDFGDEDLQDDFAPLDDSDPADQTDPVDETDLDDGEPELPLPVPTGDD
ncbi:MULTISPECIES: LPS translocon maturation chaperone LptM [unclassified Luteimonas]